MPTMEDSHEEQIQIPLDGIDPLSLYGINNSRYVLLTRSFPTLRLTARGDTLMAKGPSDEVGRLQGAFERIASHFNSHRSISTAQLEALLTGEPATWVEQPAEEGVHDAILFAPQGRIIRPRTAHQAQMGEAITQHDLLLATGPAGTGKTYMGIALAVAALKARAVRRIILTRPAVEAGERLGFLPGDLKEKLDPYLQPLYDALNDMLPARQLREHIEQGTVQIAPLAYMRGRTLDNAYVILDEAQNATLSQLRMFLTRMGNHAKFIVTGDTTQIDLADPQTSGLARTIRLLRGMAGVAHIEFDPSEIVRHPLVASIVRAFEADKLEEKKG